MIKQALHEPSQNQKKKDKKKKKNVEQNGFSHQDMVENGYAKENGHHQNGHQNGFLEATEGKETKDMTGFEFESVETNKSTWQMFSALLKVSLRREGKVVSTFLLCLCFPQVRIKRWFREPAIIFFQLILPLIYVVAAMEITQTGNYSVVTDEPLTLDAESLYKSGKLVVLC